MQDDPRRHRRRRSLSQSDVSDSSSSVRAAQAALRKWMSISIDRSRLRSPLEFPLSKSPPSGAMTNASNFKRNTFAETSNEKNSENPDTDFDYFLSDPSISEEEETGSSQADRHNKFAYSQRTKPAQSSYADTVPKTPGDWDASSAGNTSLSSSNISPMPRFRIHFDTSLHPHIKRRDRIRRKESDKTQFNRNSQMDILCKAPQKMEFHTESTTNTKTLKNEASDNRNTERKILDSDRNFIEAALMPPTGSVTAQTMNYYCETQKNEQCICYHSNPCEEIHIDIPKLPYLQHLDDQSTNEHSDSLHGTRIVTEQTGGESSSSLMTSPTFISGEHESRAEKNNSSITINRSRSSESPSKPITQRKRLRFSKTNSSPIHTRRRSGDRAAAGFVLKSNQQEDWMGLQTNGFVQAKYDDNELLSAWKANHSTQHPGIFSNDNINTTKGVFGGFETFPSNPKPNTFSNNLGVPQSSPFPFFHPEHFNASQDVHSSSSTMPISINSMDPRVQQSYVEKDVHSFSDGGGNVSHSHSNTGMYNSMVNHGSWYPSSQSGTCQVNSFMGSSVQRGKSFRDSNSKSSIGSHDFPVSRHKHSGSENENEDTESSSASSGTSTSSSLFKDDDNSSMSRKRSLEFQRLKSDHRAVRKEANRDKLTKFDKLMKRVTSVLDMPLYRQSKKKNEETSDDMNTPTFYCPNCKTRQRAFIDVTTAAGQFESPLGYLVIYFALYVASTLFIFGLEEGWAPLDCFYFSVITLTTTGLGDFVPSSDGAKLICACFIYFGVGTIGLLLGSLLAGSLDDASMKDHHDSLVRDCPNCFRLQKLKMRRSMLHKSSTIVSTSNDDKCCGTKEVGGAYLESLNCESSDDEEQNIGLDLNEINHDSLSCNKKSNANKATENLIESSDRAPLWRQQHTKHMSLSLDSTSANHFFNSLQTRRRSADFKTIDENTPLLEWPLNSALGYAPHSFESKACDDSSATTASSESSPTLTKPLSRLKVFKYIILTLNRALINSSLIIIIGSIGFYFIEGMTPVDSFYFTTVLLTTVGYGDIVPVTAAGKVFTTVYVIIAGTILLHNMSLISMIPLELRKRRIEHTVLSQFGNQLTDDKLQELSTGRLINRLKLATNRPDGLDECTREMFSLAMLVRLGRITEDDVKATFAAFHRLDAGNHGRLNSRTIIEGELRRRRSCKNLAYQATLVAPQHQNLMLHNSGSYSADDSLAFSQSSVNYNPYSYVMQSPNPFMNPINNVSLGSLRSMPSADSNNSSYASDPLSSVIDFHAYDHWNQGWHHFDTSQTNRVHY